MTARCLTGLLRGALGAALLTGLSTAMATHAHADDLTVERLHGDPALQGQGLTRLRMAPDGRSVSLLRGREDDARQQDLWTFDLESGESRMLVSSSDLLEGPEVLSDEEKNRRERQRIRGRGIVDYAWDDKGDALLFPLGGDLYFHQLADGRTQRITDTEAFETDAKISPQGRYVSFIREDEVFVYDTRTEISRQVTRGAGGTVRNGVAEFVAQEEMDRDTGYWWSPDDTRIAFTQIDEAPVAIAERLEFGADGTKTQRQRYPFTGTDNVRIRLGITTPRGAKPVWIDLGEEEDIYLARVYWSADGAALYVERQSRDQKRVDFLRADPRTGETAVLFSETSDTWLNLHHHFEALEDGGFVRASERSGFMHLYLYNEDGTIRHAITRGNWPVTDLDCVDEEAGQVYFTGWTGSVLERHVYRVPLAGGEPERLTTRAGWNDAVFSGRCNSFVLEYSAPDQPPQTSVHAADGTRLQWVNENALDDDHPYAPYLESHRPWEFGTIPADDGTPLQYAMLKPAGLKRGEKRPAVVLVYGGPLVQTVRRSWQNLFGQLLADQGYVVFRIDNRGSANRGKAFEDVLYRDFGAPEVTDQVTGAKFLQSQPFVDAERIGVYGWSYGGYMTLMLLSRAPEIYKAGVSGAPVSDWRLYDTHYTERYIGQPSNGEVYDASGVFDSLGNLSGELLLIHGMSDDNVLFQNAIQVMDSLQARGKAFELMTYPGEKHGFRKKANRIHRDTLILDFFRRTLMDK